MIKGLEYKYGFPESSITLLKSYSFAHKFKEILTEGAWLPAVDMWQHAYARRHEPLFWLQSAVPIAIAWAAIEGEAAQFFGLATAIQIIVISLIIMMPVIAYQTKPSRWTIIAVVMYTFSFAVANLYHIAFYVIEPWSPEIAELMKTIPGSPRGFALRLYQFGTLLTLAAYAVLQFFAHWDKDLQTRSNWLVVGVAECFGAIEYLGCRVFTDPFGSGDIYLASHWGTSIARSACGQTFDAGAEWIPPLVTTGFMIYVNYKYRRRT